MEKKFLLVCEGPTDFFVIEKIAEKLEGIHESKIIIRPLSPRPNPDTDEWPAQGWAGVKKWCELFKEKNEDDLGKIKIPAIREFARRQNWRALVKADNAAGIIIQIDTDIAEYISDPQPFNVNNVDRRDHLKAAIESWLGESPRPDEMYLAITSHALEAWILATHDREDNVFSDLNIGFDFENINNLEDRMIALGYESIIKRGRSRIKKGEENYRAYAERVAENLQVVRQECRAANDLCVYIES